MVKGNPWPQTRMKLRGRLSKQANKELLEIARQNLIIASKAWEAEKTAEQDSQIFFKLDEEDMETQPGPSQSASQTAASARPVVAVGRINHAGNWQPHCWIKLYFFLLSLNL